MAINALFTGTSGLQANSAWLDAIGNNLANQNTTGYKGQVVQFSDLLYQTISAGSGPTATTGGINPIQVGVGVQIGGVGSNFTQGNLTRTGRDLDFGIQGNGFFVLKNGVTTVYSRSGAFDVDSAGYLVDPTSGYRVQRFGSVGEGSLGVPGFQTPGNQDLRIPLGAAAPGTATSFANFQGNLNSKMLVGEFYTTSAQIFNTQSTAQPLNLTFTKTAQDTYDLTGTTTGGGTVTFDQTTVSFDPNTGYLLSPATIIATLSGPPAAQNININLGTPGQSVGLTQFGIASTAAVTSQDGQSPGTLNAVAVSSDGTINGTFSNGRIIPLGQVEIATFNNVDGLVRTGNNYFTDSNASSNPVFGPGGTGGRGTVQGGVLEASNVDISTEFSRLILAQRGFQVNAKTITVAGDVLAELVQIIR